MKLFLVSSAFAKRYIEEAGRDAVDELCQQASALGLSVICFPEIVSAFNRKRREKELSAIDYTHLKTRLAAEVRDADLIQLTPKVLVTSTSI